MAAKSTGLTRIIGLFVLSAIVIAMVGGAVTVTPVQASQPKQATGVTEYPFGQGYQANQDYLWNMKLVLQNVGGGQNQWVIPAKGKVYYNALAGAMNASDGYRTVYGTPGGGGCDVATMFYHVANDSGVLKAGATSLGHPKIPGVPLPAVTIWNPGSDLWITNLTDREIVIHWDYSSRQEYIKFWVDGTRSSAAPQNLLPVKTSPARFIQKNATVITGVGMGALLALVVVLLLVLRVKNPVAYDLAMRQLKRYGKAAAKVLWDSYLFFESFAIGLTTKKQRAMIFSYVMTFLCVGGCAVSIYLVSFGRMVANNAEISPDKALKIISKLSVDGIEKFVVQLPQATYQEMDYNFVNLPPVSGNCSVASFFPPTVRRWESRICGWTQQFPTLDANLIATVMTIETCGHPQLKSGAGASGLFQVMPFHFQGSEDPFNVETNAFRGLTFLKTTLAAKGDPLKALAAYNGGLGGTSGPVSSWPAETQRYYRWAKMYEDARAGASTSSTLNDWLKAGGQSMCNLKDK
jgi:hypothetical protein